LDKDLGFIPRHPTPPPLYTCLSARDTTPATPSFPQLSGKHTFEFEFQQDWK